MGTPLSSELSIRNLSICCSLMSNSRHILGVLQGIQLAYDKSSRKNDLSLPCYALLWRFFWNPPQLSRKDLLDALHFLKFDDSLELGEKKKVKKNKIWWILKSSCDDHLVHKLLDAQHTHSCNSSDISRSSVIIFQILSFFKVQMNCHHLNSQPITT